MAKIYRSAAIPIMSQDDVHITANIQVLGFFQGSLDNPVIHRKVSLSVNGSLESRHRGIYQTP